MARVGIDLDGVIYDFNESLREWLKLDRGTDPATLPPATRWEFYLDWGMGLGEFLAVCHAAANAGHLFRHGEPINDAYAQLHRLMDAGHSIHIITDRSFGLTGEPSKRATLEWLSEMGLPYNSINFTSDKAAAAIELDIHYMIDDKPENFRELFRVGVDVWLQDRPWNQGAAIGKRVTTLEEFVGHVLATSPLAPWEEELLGNNKRVIDSVNADIAAVAAATDVRHEVSASGEVRTVSSTGGEKGVKPARFDLIPARPLWQVAEHYGKGAQKYEDRNWERGYEWSKSFGAMMRHAWQFWGGEDIDVETGSHHMAAVVFHALALIEFAVTHPEFDNRPSTIATREALDVEESLHGPTGKKSDYELRA